MGRVVISLILLSLISHAIPKELSCHGEMLFQYGKYSKFRLKAQHSDKAGAWASQPRMQICFDNTGGCDTIKEINRCRTGSYYRPLWQKTQSLWGLSAPVSYRKRRTHRNETETGPCERAVTGHPAHPAGTGSPGIWSKRGGQHHTGHSHGQDPVEPQRHGGGAVYLQSGAGHPPGYPQVERYHPAGVCQRLQR